MAGRTTSVAFLGNASDLNAVADRVAAKLKETAVVAEQQNAKMAAASEAAGLKMGTAFEKGTSRAGGAVTKLSQSMAGFGIPFTGALEKVGKSLDEAESKTQKFGATMAGLGKVTVTAGLAGFAAAAYEGVKGAIALQSSMERIHTQAGATQAQVKQLTKSVEDMAGKVGIGPAQLSEGLYHIVSSMNSVLPPAQRASKEMEALKIAAEGAKVGNANLEDVTNALGAAIASNISGVQNYSQAMGALNAIVGAGDMKMQDLADALGTGLLAPMKTYGLSLKDVGAALAVFGDNNIRGQDAATKLTSAVRIMAAPSQAAAKALGVINLSTLQLANDMRSGGLIKALTDLQNHLRNSGATASQQGLIIARAFGGRQSTGVQVLLDQLDRMKSKYQQVGAGAGQFSGAWTATQQTLKQKMDQLAASARALGDKFGGWLIPKLQAVAHATSDVIGWFQRHKTVAEALAATITGVLGLAVTVFAYTKAVAFVNATKDMVGGIGKLAGGIASAVPAILAKLGLIATTSEATATAVEGSNVAAGASFAALDAEVGSAVAVADGQMALFAGTVATQDAAIEASNVAAGASFTAMLGPIGLAAAAVAGFGYALSQASNGPFLPSNVGPGTNIPQGGRGGGIGALVNGNQLPSSLTGGGLTPPSISGRILNPVGGGGFGAAYGNFINQVRAGLPGGSTSARGSNVPVPTSGSNWERIAAALKAQGFSDNAVAGILGNFAQETGGGSLSAINTRDSGNGSGGMGGMGIAQWTASRHAAERAYAAAHHEAPTDLAAQVGFLVQELRTNYHGAYAKIAGASSPQQAAALFNQYYEGGTDPNGVRERAASQALAALTGGGGGGLSPSQLAALGLGPGGSSGSKSTAAKAVRSLLYANPLPGMTNVGRTDMGVDYSATPGSAVNAIGAGVVDAIIQNWYKGQPLIEEKLTSGPNAGKFVYYAEQIKSLVHVGQQVQAGQRVGTVAAQGTGLELGFGAGGGKTLAQATTGYTEGQQTPAGSAFRQFMQQIGSHGVYTTTTGGVTTGGGSNIGYTIQQAIQQFIQGLQKAAGALITTYTNLEQSGTVKTLTKALGVSTGGKVGGRLYSTIEGLDIGKVLSATEAGKSPHALDAALIPILTKAGANSPEGKAFVSLVAELKAAPLSDLAKQLVAQHGAAMATLAQEMVAQQTLKDGELLNLQATQLKDQTQLTANTSAAVLNIHKAQTQKMTDLMQAQVTYIKDMTQVVQDRFATIAQAIQDATQQMADTSSAVVSGIQDQTQIRVDILGERGLYGLNLIAQRQQVQLDQMKAGYDQQIDAAKLNLDQVTTSVHVGEAAAQLNVDQVTLQEDHLVAMAQLRSDAVAIAQNVKIAAAQQHVDSVTLHMDASVVGPAQTAVDLGATLPKAQQDLLNGILRRAQGRAGVAEGQAAEGLRGVTDAANTAIEGAAESLTRAQGIANQMIGSAQQTLATVTGQGNAAIAGANQALTGIQDTAAQAEAALQGTIDVTKARASTQYAGSGLVVNIMGINSTDAAAIASEVGWTLRTVLPA